MFIIFQILAMMKPMARIYSIIQPISRKRIVVIQCDL